MLAGQILAPGRIELVDFPEPRLERASAPESEAEIIFQPETGCLCGSDLPYFDGEKGPYPHPPGLSLHEMVGSVVATNGRRFKPGDQVLCVPLNQTGLFERFRVAQSRAIPLPAGVTQEAGVLAQPLGTVLFALRKVPELLNLDVAVVGQGPIGQIFCMVLRSAGARQVIAIERLPERLRRSLDAGATAVVDASREDPAARIAELTGGRMADLVVECVGHRHQALNLCVDLCRQAGRILYFGVPPDEPLDGIDWHKLFFKNVAVITSVNPDFNCDFPLAMRWVAERRLPIAQLVTHRFPLARIQAAFETFRDRRDGATKVLIDFPAKRLSSGSA